MLGPIPGVTAGAVEAALLGVSLIERPLCELGPGVAADAASKE